MKKKNEIVEEVMSDLKKNILNFLQEKSYDIIKKNRGVFSMRFEENPERIIVLCNDSSMVPELKYNDIVLPVEYDTVKSNPVVLTGRLSPETQEVEEKKKDHFHRAFEGEAAKLHGMKEAIGPHSEKNEESEAFKAWKKRHSYVKVGE